MNVVEKSQFFHKTNTLDVGNPVISLSSITISMSYSVNSLINVYIADCQSYICSWCVCVSLCTSVYKWAWERELRLPVRWKTSPPVLLGQASAVWPGRLLTGSQPVGSPCSLCSPLHTHTLTRTANTPTHQQKHTYTLNGALASGTCGRPSHAQQSNGVSAKGLCLSGCLPACRSICQSVSFSLSVSLFLCIPLFLPPFQLLLPLPVHLMSRLMQMKVQCRVVSVPMKYVCSIWCG